MPDSVVRKAAELPPDVRQTVSWLLGRALEPDEIVSIIASGPLDNEERAEAWCGLKEYLKRIDAERPAIPGDELDALIEEAKDYVRHHPE